MSALVKPRVEAEIEGVRVWGRAEPIFYSIRWFVSCPCWTDKFQRYIAIVPSWEAAIEIALAHGKAFHDDT